LSKKDIIERMGLEPHPEGGFYKETYRCSEQASIGEGKATRNLSTSIYFLLGRDDVSKLHSIRSDEIWYHHEGDPVEIIDIDESGHTRFRVCGAVSDGYEPQIVVPKGNLFGARLLGGTSAGYGLVSCSVAPGFDFEDFDMPALSQIEKKYSNVDPSWQDFIKKD
jgi:predicted cupin superfamily sugar epimerase